MNGLGGTPLTEALRRGSSVPLGDVYSAISGLYFGGKRDYARHFNRLREHPPLVITPSRGLLPVDTPVDHATLRRFSETPIDLGESTYVEPLLETSRAVLESLHTGADVVLLGSVATPKYLAPLGEVFGERLLIPRSFVGRGSLSRGSLLRRAVASDRELEYVEAAGPG